MGMFFTSSKQTWVLLRKKGIIKYATIIVILGVIGWQATIKVKAEFERKEAERIAQENAQRMIITKKCTQCNLQNIDLSNYSLAGFNLDGANLRSTKLPGHLENINLEGANLQGANLRKADLRGANLQRANLQRANLQGANLDNAEFQGANLQGANLQGANLQGATGILDFTGANLKNTIMSNGQKYEEWMKK